MDRNHNVVGEVIVLTNDFNHFEEDASHIPGGKIYYSAKVVFTGFNPNRTEFIRLKQSFDHLNAHYQKESSKWPLL